MIPEVFINMVETSLNPNVLGYPHYYALLPSVILPINIWVLIFEYIFIVPGRITELDYYLSVQKSTLISLGSLSKPLAALGQIIYYSKNEFDFTMSQTFKVYLGKSFGNHRNPTFPPRYLLRFLRRVHIAVDLTDSWTKWIDYEYFLIPHPDRDTIFFQNTYELFKYCPGTRVLRLLTLYMTNLEYLDLRIIENFRRDDGDDINKSLTVYDGAGFWVRARELKLTIHPLHPRPIQGVPVGNNTMFVCSDNTPAIARATVGSVSIDSTGPSRYTEPWYPKLAESLKIYHWVPE